MSDKKTPKEPKAKNAPKPKEYVTVRLEALKADTEKGKEMLKAETQKSLIYRAIVDGDGRLTFADLVAAVTPKLKGKTQATIRANGAWYVTKLVAAGLVRRNETKEARQ